MWNWFKKKQPAAESTKPWLRVDFHRDSNGQVYHDVVLDRQFIQELDRMFKERAEQEEAKRIKGDDYQDVLYDPLMDERSKLAVFLHDYVIKTLDYDQMIRNFMSIIGEPYFRVQIMRRKDNSNVEIDSDYNKHLIYDLDKSYATNEAAYDPNADERTKIAVYLYDIVYRIAKPYLPEEDDDFIPDETMSNIPALAVRGGQEVKTVVDLGNRDAEQTGTIVDVRQ